MIIVMDSLRERISKNFNKFMGEHPSLTVPQIAEAAGVTRGMVYKWIDKINIPDPDKIEKLAKLFDVQDVDFYKPESEVVSIRPSRALKKYLVIPDDIVEDLCHFREDSEIWQDIRDAIALERHEEDSRVKEDGKSG